MDIVFSYSSRVIDYISAIKKNRIFHHFRLYSTLKDASGFYEEASELLAYEGTQ